MDDAWLASTLTWISHHPVAAGGVIFLIAFFDSLVVLGIAVPAAPLLFAVGTLVGLGHIDGAYAVACAAAGAVLGDGLSFLLGWRWGPQLRQLWPFSRYPQLLARGELLFRRHDVKSILVARFVGAIRPFVPAIAGMLRMPVRRYLPASALASVAWALVFLAPGWIFGASYDAVAAVADRLALVLGALLAVLALAWACVLYIWRWFDAHANRLLSAALRWSSAHPRVGRHVAGLIDPGRPESASLAILAACLLVIGWAWFTLLTTLLVRGELLVDRSVHAFMTTLRNPLADRLMAGLASLGDVQVLAPAAGLALLWLLWRRRFIAAAHWVGALVFGLALTALLERLIDMPKPPLAHGGFGFPSVTVTMTTITFGFFAVLIARELPGRSRVWPYLLAGVVVALLGFARIYFGAHWLSDVVGGVLLGVAWLLALGIAYRRHVARSFWMSPLGWVFYGSFALAVAWHAPRAVDPLLAAFAPPPPALTLAPAQWWQDGWQALPAQRAGRSAAARWPLDVQIAGPLAPVQARLEAAGWTVQPQAGWVQLLGLLNQSVPAEAQPVLPSTLDTEADALLLRRLRADGGLDVLRIWPAPARLDDGTPLWIGTAQRMAFTRPFGAFGLWQPDVPNHDEAMAAVIEAMRPLDPSQRTHPASGLPVLLLRTDATD